jgi:thymidylate synthase ThyX
VEEGRMRATIIDYTGEGKGPWGAADLMIFTKQTRVRMSPAALEDIRTWPEAKKLAELEYMANTIPSSWEFCRYTFMIEGVTRSLTHQLVRTRTAAYAQQTMQVLDVRGFEYHTGPTIKANPVLLARYVEFMEYANETYKWLIDEGASVEDAREILPHGILTNITMTDSLRSYANLFATRISPRNLGMFRDLCVEMRDAILEAHPWADLFLRRTFDLAAEELENRIKVLPLPDDLGADKNVMLKYVDQMKRMA